MMKPNRSLLLLSLAATMLCSCTAPAPRRIPQRQILEYTVLWVAESKKLFEQCARPSPKVNSRFIPTSMQVDTLFGDLQLHRKEIESSLPLPLDGYLYQVAGFNAGQLYLNCFAMKSYHGIPDWRALPVVTCEKGAHFWGIVYDIQKRSFDQFHFNGEQR
jgi:hypothetical protein